MPKVKLTKAPKIGVCTLRYETSQEAWDGINQYLFLKEGKLTKKGQGRNGNATLVYNLNLVINKAWVDPEFDFADMFGYKTQKWTSLVNNYLDLNYLDIIKHDIQARERKKQRNYTVHIHFKNAHNSGKACLISATFCRRLDWDIPHIIFNARASEVTKRLLIDLLLMQRMAEYIYGEKQTVSMQFQAPLAYITAEAFTMYHTRVDLLKLVKKHLPEGQLEPMQKKIVETLQKFQKIDPLTLTYRVHRRSVRQLQRDENGRPISGAAPLQAKTLHLLPKTIEYPEGILSDRKRREYRKKMKQSIKAQ